MFVNEVTKMKKTYRMQNLDCADCAAKMENKINEIDGVTSAKISFIMQKLTIEADENDIERIIREAQKICKKFEPDCKIIGG